MDPWAVLSREALKCLNFSCIKQSLHVYERERQRKSKREIQMSEEVYIDNSLK